MGQRTPSPSRLLTPPALDGFELLRLGYSIHSARNTHNCECHCRRQPGHHHVGRSNYNGGSLITGYTITSNPVSQNSPLVVGNVLTATITGLTDGRAYTFTIKAVNSAGTGAASSPSNQVTAKGPFGSISITSVCRRSAIMGHFQGEKNVREVGC